jgi:hypothetical protein
LAMAEIFWIGIDGMTPRAMVSVRSFARISALAVEQTSRTCLARAARR